MKPAATGVSAEWLALREPVDAAARAHDLVAAVAVELPAGRPTVVHDLGSGTGSMFRWLAPQLDGPQHWVLHDLDAELLAEAKSAPPVIGADGSPVTVETRCGDVSRLTAADLADASLVTASALLDVLTAAELDRIVRFCLTAGHPALLTLSVAGVVTLTPGDPLDTGLAAAFNAHQQRATDRGQLLGPQAWREAVEGFSRGGAAVIVRPSSWRLGPEQTALLRAWLGGWVGAAVEQQDDLTAAATAFARRREAELDAGRLRAEVGHQDLLVWHRRRRDGRGGSS